MYGKTEDERQDVPIVDVCAMCMYHSYYGEMPFQKTL